MKNKNKTIHVKPGPSERRLKICAVVISLLFGPTVYYTNASPQLNATLDGLLARIGIRLPR